MYLSHFSESCLPGNGYDCSDSLCCFYFSYISTNFVNKLLHQVPNWHEDYITDQIIAHACPTICSCKNCTGTYHHHPAWPKYHPPQLHLCQNNQLLMDSSLPLLPKELQDQYKFSFVDEFDILTTRCSLTPSVQ